MAQWVNELAAETDHLSLVSKTHMVEGKVRLPHIVVQLCKRAMACM